MDDSIEKFYAEVRWIYSQTYLLVNRSIALAQNY
jgi:hypothetical protein